MRTNKYIKSRTNAMYALLMEKNQLIHTRNNLRACENKIKLKHAQNNIRAYENSM